MDSLHHQLVPKHTKVSDAEKTALLKKYKVLLQHLPRILKKDPALAKLGVRSGDVIRIERESKTAGMTAYYRVVVDG